MMSADNRRRIALSDLSAAICGLSSIPGHVAKPGYDLASGLGVPEFFWIAKHLPTPAPGVSSCSRSLGARPTPPGSSSLSASSGVVRDC